MIRKLLFFALLSISIFANANDKTPLGFVENKGQISQREINKLRPDVKFKLEGNGLNSYFKLDGIENYFYKQKEVPFEKLPESFKGDVKNGVAARKLFDYYYFRFDVNFKNTNKNVTINSFNEKEIKRNYYYEFCPDGVTNVREFEKIVYKDIYSHIDLEYYIKDGRLKYDFILHQGANISDIAIEYDGVKQLRTSKDGRLLYTVDGKQIEEQAPYSFFSSTGKTINLSYSINQNVVSFSGLNELVSQEIVIDPVLEWSTFFPGVYGGYQGDPCVDSQGNIYVSTQEGGSTFPVLNAGSGMWYQGFTSGPSPNPDIVIFKFNPNYSLAWATYYGGQDYDNAWGKRNVTIDEANNSVFISGQTEHVYSNGVQNFPTQNPGGGAFYQDGPTYGNKSPFFIKLTTGGVRQWATLFNYEVGLPALQSMGINIQSIYFRNGKLYFAGQTHKYSTSGIPLRTLAGGYNNSFFPGALSPFVGRFSANGVLEWCSYVNANVATTTFFGNVADMVVDANNNLYLVTDYHEYSAAKLNTILPLFNPGSGAYFQNIGGLGFGGRRGTHITKLNPASSTALWGTFYCGGYGDLPSACEIDASNNLYITWRSAQSNDFPCFNPGGGAYYQSTRTSVSTTAPGDYYNGGSDGAIAKFSSTGVRNWATYINGSLPSSSETAINDVDCYLNGDIIITGKTVTSNFPTLSVVGSYNKTSLTTSGTYETIFSKFSGGGVIQWSSYFNNLSNLSYGAIQNTNCQQKYIVDGGGGGAAMPLNNPGGGAYYNSTTTNYQSFHVFSDVNPVLNSTAASGINTNPTNICSGNSVTLTVSGGSLGTASNWQWYSGSCGGTPEGTGSSIVVSPSSNTTYYVRAEGTCNTTTCSVVTITISPTPTISIGSITSNIICSGQAVTITPSGGSASNYTIFPGGTSGSSFVVSPTSTTTYTIRGANASGCVSSASSDLVTTITVNSPPTITTSGATSATICSGQSFVVTPSGGGTGTYTLINTGATSSTNFVFSPTANTTYTIIGANSNGCISTSSTDLEINITVNTTPTISIGSISSNVICSGQAVTITPNGGSASNYTIFPGGTSGSSFVVSPTSTTTYTIRGSNASGCVSSASSDLVTTITVNTTPNITTSGATSATICSGQSFVVTPSGGGTGSYTLTNTGATSSTNFVLSPTASTNYTIIGANSNGCVSNTSTDLNISITVNATPTITTTGATAATICSGASYTITPSGGVGSYTLVNTGATSGTNFIVTPNATTTYSVIGASANGCISSTSSDLNVVLTVNSTPTVNATFSSNALCSSQNVTITLAGASGTYTLLPGSLTSTSSFVVSPPAGTTVYTVIANNTNGCVSTLSSQIYTTSVSVVTNPTITASFITNTICAGSTATITPFGANTFTLLPNNISVASGGSFTLTPTVATTYTINGTATGGCVSVPSTQFVTTIGVSTTPTVSLSSVSPSAVLCSGQSATLTVTGAVAGTYTILNTGSSSSPLVVTPLTTTTYTIVGAATNGCVSNASTDLETTITVNQSPTLSVSSQQNVLCFGNATGSVNVSSSGGTGTTTITPLTTTNLSAGTYTYVTTDALGCSSSSVITITEPTSAVAVLAATPTASNSNCVVFNGSASVSSTGGTGSVTVSWNGGAQTGTSVTGLNTGINTFTLTDANGCTNSANTGTINIDGVLGILTTAVSQSSVNCKGELTGAVTFTTSGVGPNSYTLTNTLTNTSITNATGIFTGLSAGNYSVYVLGNGGCVDTQALTIAEPSASVSLVGGAVTSNTVSCFGGNAIITATATGGSGNFTYVWGANTSTVSTASYPVGTYTMMVIDGNNCGLSNVQSFTVTQPTSSVTISSVANTTLACNGGTTTVTAIVTGGSGNYNYQWQAPSTSTTNTATYTAGVYTMSATDGNGCASATHTVIVTQPTNALTVSQVTLVSSCPNQNSGSVEIVATGGTPLYTVLWSNNATTFLVTNLPEGSISAIVTDASGCVSNYSTTIITENCIKISVPTFFSPNGDGKNDFLVINAASEFPNNKLEIFNRWGSLVYSKTPYNDTFDGKANVSSVVGSGMLPAGTYYIIFDFGDGETPVYKSYLELKW